MGDEAAAGSDVEVEGVSLERYAEVAVALHAADPEEADAIAQRHGIPAGTGIQAIAEGWNQRFVQQPELVQRYSDLYQQAMRKAGIQAPDITLEQYAEILKSGASGDAFLLVLQRFGLTLQTFAMVSQGWIDKMAADPSCGRSARRADGALAPVAAAASDPAPPLNAREDSHHVGKHTLRTTGIAREEDGMAKDHGPSVKNDKQYEGLRKKGMSKSRAAAIANSPGSSSRGGKKSHSGGRSTTASKAGGTRAQKAAAGRKGGKKSS